MYHILFKPTEEKKTTDGKVWETHFSSTNNVYAEKGMWVIGHAHKIYRYMYYYLIGGTKIIYVGSGVGSLFPKRELKVWSI